MATLSLKKPVQKSAPIERAPLQDLTNRYAVMRQSRNSKAMRFTCTHDTEQSALDEVKRLLVKVPGSRFLVMRVVGHMEE